MVAPIEILNMYKVGVGPSSSHTLGPWRAVLHSIERFKLEYGSLKSIDEVNIELFGSLSKTGVGHGTDRATIWGLSGLDPQTVEKAQLRETYRLATEEDLLLLGGSHKVNFTPKYHIVFKAFNLPYHPNALIVHYIHRGKGLASYTYYSIGGGNIEWEGAHEDSNDENIQEQYPDSVSAIYQSMIDTNTDTIGDLFIKLYADKSEDIKSYVSYIMDTMISCAFSGIKQGGILPGGLKVKRRAKELALGLMGDELNDINTAHSWRKYLRNQKVDHLSVFRWVSCFALAVNEENAAFGRVVTAPTNGSAGVIPSVLLYYMTFIQSPDEEKTMEFMLTAAWIGDLFKRRATISAAMGGCQAEIGVSSSMAAGGLCAAMGGTVQQSFMAAEIAMEHHLGMTCDPVAGLVQVPCIERNAMGAIKAITAANLALNSDPDDARISLEDVVETMWNTALDMKEDYKETAQGGLALRISTNVAEC